MDESRLRPDQGPGAAPAAGSTDPEARQRDAPEGEGAPESAERDAPAVHRTVPRIGSTVSGTVLAVHRDEALIDVGAKVDGLLPLPTAGVPDPVSGQVLTVTVVGFDSESGAPRLARRHAAADAAWQAVAEAERSGMPIEGTVREQVKGGLVLDVGVRAFMPASQVERGYVADLAPYVGQTLRVRVLEYDRGRAKVILSRRAVLEEEARQRREQVWSELEEGQIREGVVKGLTDFGAFIDLGGVDGLLHVSAMSWERVERPSDILSIGDPVRVRVVRLDREKQKISLGLKQVEPDPWAGAAERYPVGTVVQGRVMRLCSFGAFVQLQPGVDGLIHISQLSDQRVNDPGEVVREGDIVHTTVLRVSPAERRISLSLRGTAPLPARPAAAETAPAGPPSAPVTLGDMVGEVGALLRQEFSGPNPGGGDAAGT